MSSRFDTAIAFAQAHETAWSREPAGLWGIYSVDPPPYNRLFGPVSPRGPVSGVVEVAGKVVAQWGEPRRPDLTFSIAKTYLALLAGVASDRGLLPDVNETVVARVPGVGFDSPHNRSVTWAQLLQQTSEWEGSCFDIPDTVDRYRVVQYQRLPPAGKKGEARPLQPPGTYWEYNDVRINQLALALLHLFRRPLPEVFRESIMQPVGASDTWQWVGYDHAWIELDGRRVQSVPGGSHWGAGVTISAADQVRIGRMMLDGGRSGQRQVVSSAWLAGMREPCAIAPFYGRLVWLNTDGAIFPSTPASSWFAVGAGTSIMWLDPQRDAVVVVRWINGDHADELFGLIGAAIDQR